MAATAAMIAQLRRMGGLADDDASYTDSILSDMIEKYPLVDARGENPWVESTTTPGTLEVNDDWTPSYDLNAAAADVWTEKAGLLAGNYDFETQDQSFKRSQAYEQAMQQARHYRSRRSWKTVKTRPEPDPTDDEDDLSN